jgi:hypothetical protein
LFESRVLGFIQLSEFSGELLMPVNPTTTPEPPKLMPNELIFYKTPDGEQRIEVVYEDENFWMSQAALAELFGVKRPAMTKHLGNIFSTGELAEEEVSSILEHTTQHGAIEGKTQTRKVKFYNLDAIIAIGFRVRSTRGSQFRRWANTRLQEYLVEDFTDEIIDLFQALKKEKDSFADLGIDIEEKAFYDILKSLTIKYDFEYPEDKLLQLAKRVKTEVDDKAKYTDWSQREDIKAELKVNLIILLADNDYPPVNRDEVYKEIFEQAQNFKKHHAA